MTVPVMVGTVRSGTTRPTTVSDPAYSMSFGFTPSTSSVSNTGGNRPMQAPQQAIISAMCSLGLAPHQPLPHRCRVAREQASRLVAIDSSTRNTERMLKTLIDLERRERQGEITRQVLELIGARFAAGS
jgi:hypothetical protein